VAITVGLIAVAALVVGAARATAETVSFGAAAARSAAEAVAPALAEASSFSDDNDVPSAAAPVPVVQVPEAAAAPAGVPEPLPEPVEQPTPTAAPVVRVVAATPRAAATPAPAAPLTPPAPVVATPVPATCPATWFCYPRLGIAGLIVPYTDCSGSTDVGTSIRSYNCISDHYLMGHAYTQFGLVTRWASGDVVFAWGQRYTVSGAITQQSCAAPSFPLAPLSLQTSLTSNSCGAVLVVQAR
jgi:hypothetical protein